MSVTKVCLTDDLKPFMPCLWAGQYFRKFMRNCILRVVIFLPRYFPVHQSKKEFRIEILFSKTLWCANPDTYHPPIRLSTHTCCCFVYPYKYSLGKSEKSETILCVSQSVVTFLFIHRQTVARFIGHRNIEHRDITISLLYKWLLGTNYSQ